LFFGWYIHKPHTSIRTPLLSQLQEVTPQGCSTSCSAHSPEQEEEQEHALQPIPEAVSSPIVLGGAVIDNEEEELLIPTAGDGMGIQVSEKDDSNDEAVGNLDQLYTIF
jgi:hypothetical protein